MHLRPFSPQLEEAPSLPAVEMLLLPLREPHQLVVVGGESGLVVHLCILSQEDVFGREVQDEHGSHTAGEQQLHRAEKEVIEIQFVRRKRHRRLILILSPRFMGMDLTSTYISVHEAAQLQRLLAVSPQDSTEFTYSALL